MEVYSATALLGPSTRLAANAKTSMLKMYRSMHQILDQTASLSALQLALDSSLDKLPYV